MSLACSLLLAAFRPAAAQAPDWNAALTSSLNQPGGRSRLEAVATDASGNVFVTGSFYGRVAFGQTLLVSRGSSDLFVAKYVPAAGTWAWAQGGGGTSYDQGLGIAVSGSNVYVTGGIVNNSANRNQVVFGGAGSPAGGTSVSGASSTVSQDLVVVKYLDNGPSATLGWTQVGGGNTDEDLGTGIAVSGANVYVTGYFKNTLDNANGVLFGGTGTSPGTVPVNGTSSNEFTTDLLLVKYFDNGSNATLGWTQVGGGPGADQGSGVAVSGPAVYVTGYISGRAVFGGTGTTPGTVAVKGGSFAAGTDLVVAKYTDAGPSATLGWTQVGGGAGDDQGLGIAASGTSVYVTGFITNNVTDINKLLFDNNVQVNGASSEFFGSQDFVLAKYTDSGPAAALSWTQVGGGIYDDAGVSVAVSGSSVYVTGYLKNNTSGTARVVFGGSGTTPGTVAVKGAGSSQRDNYDDLLLAKYTDNGTSATLGWAQAGGGTGVDQGRGVAVSGSKVYAAGYVRESLTYSFGTAAPGPLGGTIFYRAVLAQVDDQGATGRWENLVAAYNGGGSQVNGVATDAAGNVFVTGFFYGQVAFGQTLLTSQGKDDLFVAKYTPATGTWAWAQSGGGTGDDRGQGIAVSGAGIFVTGFIGNDAYNNQHVLVGGTGTTPGTVQVNGAGTGNSLGSYDDLVLIKYQDQGSRAAVSWTQVGGGRHSDQGLAVAVSGVNVYVTGFISNTTDNQQRVVFGGSGTTPGTVQVNGACTGTNLSTYEDLLVVKYIDQGNSATLGWTQVGGGRLWDHGTGVAVSGTNVYVTGYFNNTSTNDDNVVFGGSGTTPGTMQVNGTTSLSKASQETDLLLVKYIDQGNSATLGWTQVGGGSSFDAGYGVAVSGTRIYVTGVITNNTSNSRQVVFGGTVQVNGASPSAGEYGDLALIQYTDQGSAATLGWTQIGGGSRSDVGYGVAVSGPNVYVTGFISNTATNDYGVVFGGSGTTPGTVAVAGVGDGSDLGRDDDFLLAKFTDQGSFATLNWTQVGGGNGDDVGLGVAVTGSSVYAAGFVSPSTIAPGFGSYRVGPPVGGGGPDYVTLALAHVTDAALPLSAVMPQATTPPLTLLVSPNPSRTAEVVQAVGQSACTGPAELLLSDALGRVLWHQTVHLISGLTTALPVPALPGPGLYLLRLQAASGATVSTRLVRE